MKTLGVYEVLNLQNCIFDIYSVYTIFLIETAQTALTGADMYYWFVTGYGNLSRFTKSYLSPIDIPLFAAIISLIVQVFFCHRIYGLQKSFWPICALIFLVTSSPFQFSARNNCLLDFLDASFLCLVWCSHCWFILYNFRSLCSYNEQGLIANSGVHEAEVNQRIVIVSG